MSDAKLREAAQALLDKLDAAAPHLDGMCVEMHVRGRPYSGPQFGTEKVALRDALSAPAEPSEAAGEVTPASAGHPEWETLTEQQCDEFRRHKGTFNDMLQAVYEYGRGIAGATANEHFSKHYHERYEAALDRTRSAREAAPVAVAVEIDTGDHVLHVPSGETWIVAYVRDGRLCACGWPESIVPLVDCRLVKRATDEQRIDLLKSMAWSDGSRATYAQERLRAATPQAGAKEGT